MSPATYRRLHHTIWIVDDSPPDHTLLKLAFKDYGLNAAFVSFFSAEDAVAALLDGQAPSLVLLDLNMPGLGGEHFLTERQRGAHFQFPVVILTSSSNPDDIKSTYALGANSYLEKPSDYDTLREFASHVASYWFRWAHLPEATLTT